MKAPVPGAMSLVDDPFSSYRSQIQDEDADPDQSFASVSVGNSSHGSIHEPEAGVTSRADDDKQEQVFH
jgi:hypothetical protein